jgi:hypothetical protein
LVKDSGREVFIKPELEIDVRIEGASGFAKKPTVPIGIFFA